MAPQHPALNRREFSKGLALFLTYFSRAARLVLPPSAIVPAGCEYGGVEEKDLPISGERLWRPADGEVDTESVIKAFKGFEPITIDHPFYEKLLDLINETYAKVYGTEIPKDITLDLITKEELERFSVPNAGGTTVFPNHIFVLEKRDPSRVVSYTYHELGHLRNPGKGEFGSEIVALRLGLGTYSSFPKIAKFEESPSEAIMEIAPDFDFTQYYWLPVHNPFINAVTFLIDHVKTPSRYQGPSAFILNSLREGNTLATIENLISSQSGSELMSQVWWAIREPPDSYRLKDLAIVGVNALWELEIQPSPAFTDYRKKAILEDLLSYAETGTIPVRKS